MNLAASRHPLLGPYPALPHLAHLRAPGLTAVVHPPDLRSGTNTAPLHRPVALQTLTLAATAAATTRHRAARAAAAGATAYRRLSPAGPRSRHHQ